MKDPRKMAVQAKPGFAFPLSRGIHPTPVGKEAEPHKANVHGHATLTCPIKMGRGTAAYAADSLCLLAAITRAKAP